MADVLERIDEAVKKNPVMIFMKGTPQFPQCGFSGRAVEILKAHEIADVIAAPGAEKIESYAALKHICEGAGVRLRSLHIEIT